MSLSDLVKMNISASTATPSKPGFGTTLIAAQKVPASFGTGRVKQYGSLTEMTDAGFLVSDPAYLCAEMQFAQDPAPDHILVGKRANHLTQTVQLTCHSANAGDVYNVTVAGHAITYTVPSSGSPTTSTVATAIAALIDALSEVSAVAASNVITVTTASAGVLVDYADWTPALFTFADTTNDPGGTSGLADDLAKIAAGTTLDWYGLALDSNSSAEIQIAALFTETNKKVFVPNNSDSANADPDSTTDAMSLVKAAAYARTGVLFSKRQLLSYSGAAWTAKQFAGAEPGSDTWAFKTLAGVTVDDLLDGERSAILAKNGNFYAPTSSINITQFGTSGAGEFLDIVRFIDWQKAEIQFLVFTALINNKKIPYSDLGIDAIGSIILSGLQEGEAAGGLVEKSSVVTVPKAASISSATKGTRKLSGVKFTAELAGAIHSLEIDGSLVP